MEETPKAVNMAASAKLTEEAILDSDDLLEDVTLTAAELEDDLKGRNKSLLHVFDEESTVPCPLFDEGSTVRFPLLDEGSTVRFPLFDEASTVRCSSVCDDKISEDPKEDASVDDVFGEDIFDARLSPIRPVGEKPGAELQDDRQDWIDRNEKTYEELVSGISALCELNGPKDIVFEGNFAPGNHLHCNMVSSTPDVELLKKDKFKALFDVKNREVHHPQKAAIVSSVNCPPSFLGSPNHSIVIGQPGRFKDVDVSRQTETDSGAQEEISDEGVDVLGLDEFTTFVDSDKDDMSLLNDEWETIIQPVDSCENNTLQSQEPAKSEPNGDKGIKRKPSEAFVLDLEEYSDEVNEFLQDEVRKDDQKGTGTTVKKQKALDIEFTDFYESDVFEEDVRTIVKKQIADMVKEVSEMNEEERHKLTFEVLKEPMQRQTTDSADMVDMESLVNTQVSNEGQVDRVNDNESSSNVKSELSEYVESAASIDSAVPYAESVDEHVSRPSQPEVKPSTMVREEIAGMINQIRMQTEETWENGPCLDVSLRSIPLPAEPYVVRSSQVQTKGDTVNNMDNVVMPSEDKSTDPSLLPPKFLSDSVICLGEQKACLDKSLGSVPFPEPREMATIGNETNPANTKPIDVIGLNEEIKKTDENMVKLRKTSDIIIQERIERNPVVTPVLSELSNLPQNSRIPYISQKSHVTKPLSFVVPRVAKGASTVQSKTVVAKSTSKIEMPTPSVEQKVSGAAQSSHIVGKSNLGRGVSSKVETSTPSDRLRKTESRIPVKASIPSKPTSVDKEKGVSTKDSSKTQTLAAKKKDLENTSVLKRHMPVTVSALTNIGKQTVVKSLVRREPSVEQGISVKSETAAAIKPYSATNSEGTAQLKRDLEKDILTKVDKTSAQSISTKSTAGVGTEVKNGDVTKSKIPVLSNSVKTCNKADKTSDKAVSVKSEEHVDKVTVKTQNLPAEKVAVKTGEVKKVISTKEDTTKAGVRGKPSVISPIISGQTSTITKSVSDDAPEIRSTETLYLSEDNALIQQVKKRWECKAIPSPETNLTCANYWRRQQRSRTPSLGPRNGELEGHFRLSPLIEKIKSKERVPPTEIRGNKRKCADSNVFLDATQGYRWDGKRARYDQHIGSSSSQVYDSIKQQIEKLEQNFRDRSREIFQHEDKEKNRLSIQHELLMEKLAAHQRREMQELYASSYNHQGLHRQFMWLRQQHQYRLNQEQETYYNNIDRLTEQTKKKISDERKNYFEIAEQLEQLMNKERTKSQQNNGRDVTYKMITLVKAPCRSNNQKKSWVKVCLPADIGSAIIREDLIYDAFYVYDGATQ